MSSYDSGFTNFEEARQALIFRYYHPQADYTCMIEQPRNNSQYPQNLTIDSNTYVYTDPISNASVTDSSVVQVAQKSMMYPQMDTMYDFATQYMLLLGQWNQKDLFEEKKIKDFVNYIEIRKSNSHLTSITNVQNNDANVTLLSSNLTLTTQPWSRGNERYARELVDSYFTIQIRNRT